MSEKCVVTGAAMTAKMTANMAHDCGRSWIATELRRPRSNSSSCLWTSVDVSHAVFKTAGGRPQTSIQVHFCAPTSAASGR